MKANNPMFSTLADQSVDSSASKASLKGVIVKTGLLLIITMIVSIYLMATELSTLSYGMLIASTIIGFISVMIGRTNPNVASICGVIYAVCEGIFLGYLSAIVNSYAPGAVPIAVVSTFTVFVVMLVLYSMKIVQASPVMYKVLSTVGISILLFSFMTVILSLFGNNFLSSLFFENSMFAAILCAGFIVYGSFMLVINFEEARAYTEQGFDKKYEWCAALGLIITIIYIYIQILRFVALIMAKRD